MRVGVANFNTGTVDCNCPFCGKTTKVSMSHDKLEEYHLNPTMDLDSVYSMNAFNREAIISGLCYSCQERTFNMPAPGNEEKWGKQAGECQCCGATLWDKDRNESGFLICPSCGWDEKEYNDES